MVMWHSTYHAFGVHVPEDKFVTMHAYQETEWLDGLINHTTALRGTGVGHLSAGNYDRDMLFLVVVPEDESCQVDLGEFKLSPAMPLDFEQIEEWTSLIQQLAELAGYGDLGTPGWLTIPDVS